MRRVNAPILVVEDEEAMRLLLREFLEILGYPVVLAVDGRDALQMAGSTAVGLAFLDLNLPDMNGLELMQKLRASGAAFPIVVLSANLKDSFPADAAALGIAEFLEKPVDLDVLEALIRNILPQAAA